SRILKISNRLAGSRRGRLTPRAARPESDSDASMSRKSIIPRVEPEGMLFRKPVPTFRDHALVCHLPNISSVRSHVLAREFGTAGQVHPGKSIRAKSRSRRQPTAAHPNNHSATFDAASWSMSRKWGHRFSEKDMRPRKNPERT